MKYILKAIDIQTNSINEQSFSSVARCKAAAQADWGNPITWDEFHGFYTAMNTPGRLYTIKRIDY